MHRYTDQQPYDPTAGPWPTNHSKPEQESQREAGAKLLEDVRQAVQDGAQGFKIPAGVYRLPDSFCFDSIEGFTLEAKGVELITETDGPCATLRILGCQDFRLLGPVTLDGSPFGFSQGTVLKTDGKSFVEYNPMEGYPPAIAGHRTTFFNPKTGIMIARYQDVIREVKFLTEDRVRLKFDAEFFQMYGRETAQAVQPGNLIAIENPDAMRGGIELRDNTGMHFADVAMHTFSLNWALPMSGDVHMERFTGCRRPGTNRLMGGGFFAFSMFGGNVRVNDCELGHNFDDITDIGSELGFAFNQVAPNQLYVGISNMFVGKTLVFYDNYTLKETGRATVVECKLNEDSGITEAFWETLKKALVLTWDTVPYLVTLDKDKRFSELELVDCIEARPDSLVVTNSYFHDSLAAGISVKGAKRIHIEGNVIERAGYRAIGAGFDPYWWEGGIPSNIVIKNNLVLDSPFNLPDLTPAINIYVDAAPAMLEHANGCPMHNVTITGNTVERSKTAAIGVAYARHVTVAGNMVQEPMAAGFQTRWGGVRPYEHPCAIWLDSVEDCTIAGNKIEGVDMQRVSQVICASGKTHKSGIRLAENVVLPKGGQTQALPDTFFHRVGSSSAAVQYSGEWAEREWDGAYAGRYRESTLEGAAATYCWTGTRGRMFGILRSSYGQVDIYVDRELQAVVDLSELPAGFEELIPSEGIGTQMLFDSGPLAQGLHELVAVVRGRPSGRCTDGSVGVGIDAFDCIEDVTPS